MRRLNLEILTEENKKRLDKQEQQVTKDYWEQFRSLTFEQFWVRVGKPQKDGTTGDIYPYEQHILQLLKSKKLLWIKKATGLGITEFFLRWIAWKAVTDPTWKGTEDAQVAIVTGPNWETAIGLMRRLKGLFSDFNWEDKETVAIIDGCRVQAFPSNHLEAMRALKHPRCILLDEADFFPPGEQDNARTVSERYIAKSNPFIFLVSTPWLPGGLFERIEKEQNSIYERLFLDYKVGEGYVYTKEDIKQAKRSPSFEREYNLKYGQGIGNIFPYELVDSITKPYELALQHGQKVLAVDPAYGSSKFAVVGFEEIDGIIYVKEAKQYERPDPGSMLQELARLSKTYGVVISDSARPEIWEGLQRRGVNASPIDFSKQLGVMTPRAVEAVKEDRVRIHTAFTELQYQLKAVTFNDKGHPDKKKLSFDQGDCFLMGINYLSESMGEGNWAFLPAS